MKSAFSSLFAVCTLFSSVGLVACQSTKEDRADAVSDSSGNEEKATRQKGAKGKEQAPPQDRAGAQQQSGAASQQPKNAPSAQSPLTYVVTSLANEDTFAGQIPQPKLEDVLRSLEQTYRERTDDGGAIISYLVFRRLSGTSRDFLSVLERRGSTASSRDPWILLESSYTALLRNDYGMAQYLLDTAEVVGKGNAKVNAAILHARGLMHYQQKKTVLAMAAFREAAKASYEPAMLTLALFALKVGDHEGALEQLGKLKDFGAGNLNVKAALGIAYRQAGKPEEAVEFLNQVLRSRPNDKRALWNYALALSEIPAKRREAISTLEKYNTAQGYLVDIDNRVRSLLEKLQAQEAAAKAQANKPDESAAGAKAEGQ
jgi:tetratricopeptide (TPR) repeat protein